ncbi:MAG: polysaccharide biosynthesis/export family protein [Flavobacterium sp.]|nr:polysaccharide biosynthesis/export family protein [Pedobacter sp.]
MRRIYPAGYSLLYLITLLLIFSSCSTRYEHALFKSETDVLRDTIKTVFVVNSSAKSADFYRIKANDLLAVRNLQGIGFLSSETSGEAGQPVRFEVQNDGNVVLPMLGPVMVAGLSRKEAAEKIQAAYKLTLLKDPIIELSIVNLKVTLLGEFGSEGEFLLEDDETTLIDIIGKAGGFSPIADPKTLKIIRGDRSNPEIIYVNLQNINSLASPKLKLQNNDIVYIEPTGISNASQKIQSVSAILQPVLLVVNFALLIYNFTK